MIRVHSINITISIILMISLFSTIVNGSTLIVVPDFNDQDHICLFIWDFKSNEVTQSEDYSIKLTIYNPNIENISIIRIGLHFDWFGNESYNNDIPIYRYPENMQEEDGFDIEKATIKSNNLKNYYINGTLEGNVSVGYHQYHFEIIIDPFDRLNISEMGAIPPPPYNWRSPVYSDFQVSVLH